MSSRNNYLTSEHRAIASQLYQNMMQIVDKVELGRRDFSAIIREHRQKLTDAGFKVDYIEIRSADNLLQPGHEDQELVVLMAAFLGKTRLIDNCCVSLGD
jgi:pantoate--beta-alanine ligase